MFGGKLVAIFVLWTMKQFSGVSGMRRGGIEGGGWVDKLFCSHSLASWTEQTAWYSVVHTIGYSTRKVQHILVDNWSVVWWLSASAVWRFTENLPHHHRFSLNRTIFSNLGVKQPFLILIINFETKEPIRIQCQLTVGQTTTGFCKMAALANFENGCRSPLLRFLNSACHS
jgi:hypothetical protein